MTNQHKTEKKLTQHGTVIALDQSYPGLTSAPLEINGQCRSASDQNNPDRYKQHGFHFNADNCIACHACESACSEKNDLAPHMAYRKVGTIEGGTYPDVTRINISMACNHCEDPVCLKGCPTRAYTKYLEYGAVLQDPEICFGCGYCTWVCPYNAPQLDTEKGQVQKCNMCIDRLEVGLQPACVSACLSSALDFGVIETLPEKQKALNLTIPGFPDPSISRPNIRFQLESPLPETFQRADDLPMTYSQIQTENGLGTKKESPQSRFKIKEKKPKTTSGWGFGQLRSREDPLVLFTLISQFVVGAFLLIFLMPQLNETAATLLSQRMHPRTMAGTLLSLVTLQTFALVSSTLHLGKPRYFYRAMNNLRHSWVSREIAAMGAFYGFLCASSLVTVFPNLSVWLPDPLSRLLPVLFACGAATFGPVGIYCMYRCYRIPARPFWDHWHSGGAFFSSALILGSSAIGLIFGVAGLLTKIDISLLLGPLSIIFACGLLIQRFALFTHARDLERRGEEAAVSNMLMMSRFGKTYRARLLTWSFLMSAALIFIAFPPSTAVGMMTWAFTFLISAVHELIGRALFYVLVIPTTVPRGFFWGNHSFESLARKTGLAKNPQAGVSPDEH